MRISYYDTFFLISMHILCLQSRKNQVVRDHELDAIKQYAHQPEAVWEQVDTCSFEMAHLTPVSFDAIIIGGSGEYCLTKGHLEKEMVLLKTFLAEARTKKIPILGICFGAQILTKIFGGALLNDKAREESGTFAVSLMAPAKKDPIFSQLPEIFDAQFGHEDHIDSLPEGAVHLAATPRSFFQAWVFPNEPVYAMAFHPELDQASILFRMRYYQEKYGWSDEEVEQKVSGLRSSPDANQLIELFFKEVVKSGKRYHLIGA